MHAAGGTLSATNIVKSYGGDVVQCNHGARKIPTSAVCRLDRQHKGPLFPSVAHDLIEAKS